MTQNHTAVSSVKLNKTKKIENPFPSGIILYDKKIGVTSFQSLGAIKRALGTKKIGHTGTLDSFASGLLVVCVGSLTRLASHITAFDKEYEAEITFGKETDTLELTGNVIRTAPLPTEENFRKAVLQFTGVIDQTPPQFSAIHVDGKRASEIMRSGKNVELPARCVTVYSAEIREIEFADAVASEGVSASESASPSVRRVQSAHIHFSVSKGTYIRSLARDIANACGSAGHLTSLRRTKVGSFSVEDAVSENDDIISALNPMTEKLAEECGFAVAHLHQEYVDDFQNGKQLRKNFFDTEPFGKFSVFSEKEKDFLGIVEHEKSGKYSYVFVVPKNA